MNYFIIVDQLLQLRFLFHITAFTVNGEERDASNSHKSRDCGNQLWIMSLVGWCSDLWDITEISDASSYCIS